MRRFYLGVFFSLLLASLPAQRMIQDLGNDWEFSKTGESFEAISLPHTYNDRDAFDDEPGYYRGGTVYRKVLDTRKWNLDHRHYLRFYGVNQRAGVAMNGTHVGEHIGGYTAFVLDITSYLTFGKDTLIVRVDNQRDESVPPLIGDFTFYGGIYRKVEHISVPATHFDPDIYGADGVFIDPLRITTKLAEVRIRVYESGFDENAHQIRMRLIDPEGKITADTYKFMWDEELSCWAGYLILSDPVLWSDTDPRLYTFRFELVEKASGNPLDQLNVPYGFRYFHFDADKGFFLNGEHRKLVGVNRHQDLAGIGNALTADQHARDMDLIREMGANFLRTAHYPQDPLINDYCDRNGILVSMEIPLDHEISGHPDFNENSRQMMLEMIHQYYNHPSVIIWAYMNEMGLRMDPVKDSLELVRVVNLARDLEDLTREADPFRYTMIPNHGYFDIYEKFGFLEIPMIVGWNLYFGWYVPDFEGFGKFLDKAHAKVPHKPIIVSEYGAGADPRITSFRPVRFDFSVNWAVDFHRAHLEQILERDFVAGSAVWNMFDFGSESRKDAVPHINNKGLCGFDRMPKAPFYVYQQYLRPELGVTIPFPAPEYILRDPGMEQEVPQNYTGKVLTPETFWQDYSVLNVNFGTDFYFNADGANWLPDTDLPGTLFTYEGDTRRAVVRDQGIGTDRAIAASGNDPVYQTWITASENLSFYIPNGHYRLILHLSNNSEDIHPGLTLRFPSLPARHTGELKPYRAYRFEMDHWVTGGLKIQLSAGSGAEPFINGIQIIRL
jgi:beta-galactosidase